MMNVVLDNSCLGKFKLVSVKPDYYGSDKVRHYAPVGAKYEVVLPMQLYERLMVKIPGAQLMETPVSGHEPIVEFADLIVKPYVDHSGHIAFSAAASGIKVVDTTAGTGKAAKA